ncbi:MAG TPA: hypothetical protein PKY96_18935, partial [Flavobacteriales bacterium]|nr:hypothetical protein [Flavobacteriales bacterium]
MANTPDIRSLTLNEVKTLVAELGEKPYRAKQLWEWLWKKKAHAWDDMSDLPKAFRAALAERTVLRPLVLAEEQRSNDGTVSGAQSSFVLGIASDYFLSGDWDGDGIDDAAVWRAGASGQFIIRP